MTAQQRMIAVLPVAPQEPRVQETMPALAAALDRLPRRGTGGWTRRAWLVTTAGVTRALFGRARPRRPVRAPVPAGQAVDGGAGALPLDPGPVQALAQRAVDAARSAGASYADARLTRTVEHHYVFGFPGQLVRDFELAGCGVRVLVDGAWGFASAPVWVSEPDRADLVVQLARAAVAQARTAAAAGRRPPVALSPAPAVTGTWQTPCRIDPFSISVEEKLDTIAYWEMLAQRAGVEINPVPSYLHCARQERVLVTSEGTRIAQTCYESGGQIVVGPPAGLGGGRTGPTIMLRGLAMAGQGWERFLDAKIPEQLQGAAAALTPAPARPVVVGRYTVVCDGATIASVLGETLGIATQLDRALAYEANGGGTSFLSDPLAMLGTFSVGAPLVTVTANRSAPTQLATVQWDTEGVVPPATTLIKAGVLHDFQTTREQAAWLAPYYQKVGRPVASNGCAAAQDGLRMPLQMRPNLALAPNAASAPLAALIGSVENGFLVEDGIVWDVDAQARNGVLTGKLRRIERGRLTYPATGGVVQVNTMNFWKAIQSVGDASTTGVYSATQYNQWPWPSRNYRGDKGQPMQRTSYSAQGVAAVVANQPIINPRRKA